MSLLLSILISMGGTGCSAIDGQGSSLERVLSNWDINGHAEQGKVVRWAKPPQPVRPISSAVGSDDRPVLVFIEGDGRAWRSRRVRAENPTPSQAVAAQLAKLSTGDNEVLYLARPCQFLDDRALAELKECTPKLWTDERYSSETITLLSDALDVALDPTGRRLVLVGYSGGGVIAAVLAAQRDDVVGLMTVAANLSVDTWTAHHRVSPLRSASLPTDYAARLGKIPQYHLLGTQDTIVPKIVHDAYLAALTDLTQVKTVYVDGYDHSCCWPESWLDHLHRALAYFNENSKGVGVTSLE